MKLGLCLVLTFFHLVILEAKEAVYTPASDMFELVYHVAANKGPVGRAYHDAFVTKVKMSSEMAGDFKRFKEIRDAYLVSSKTESDIFGDLPPEKDLIARAFHREKDLRAVLQRLLKAEVPAEEVKFLSAFFKKYKKDLLTFLKESSQFNVKVLSLEKEWKYKSYAKAFKHAKDFILPKERKKKFKLLMRPVWWPSNEAPRVDFVGDTLILRYNPLKHTGNWNLPVVMEKSIEMLLHAQGEVQRSNLTKIFKAECPGRELELRAVLGTMFSEMMPKQLANKKTFSVYDKWGTTHFTDVYLKLLYPMLIEEQKKRAPFSGKFMEKASSMCRSIDRLSVAP